MAFRNLKPYHPRKPQAVRSVKVTDYDTKAWRDYSLQLRTENNICAKTGNEYLPKMLVVDHIIPVNEGGSFWDKRNHQVLSLSEHSRKSMREKAGCKTPFIFNKDGEKIPLNHLKIQT